MKKLLVATVAAVALMGTMASEADAFGIVIRFGGFHVRHVGRSHHFSSRRHRSETRTASRGAKPAQTAKAEPTNPANHYSGKDEVPAMAQALSGEQRGSGCRVADILEFPKVFREAIGPVSISTFLPNIADYRRIRQAYDAGDSGTVRLFLRCPDERP